jgi:sulfur relay protein TusB/DsrH
MERREPMIIMIKSAPDTTEAKRAVMLAGDLAADIILVQNAVYFARRAQASGSRGVVYALDEDLRMRGIGPRDDLGAVKRIDYDMLVDLITKADRVHGAF